MFALMNVVSILTCCTVASAKVTETPKGMTRGKHAHYKTGNKLLVFSCNILKFGYFNAISFVCMYVCVCVHVYVCVYVLLNT